MTGDRCTYESGTSHGWRRCILEDDGHQLHDLSLPKIEGATEEEQDERERVRHERFPTPQENHLTLRRIGLRHGPKDLVRWESGEIT